MASHRHMAYLVALAYLNLILSTPQPSLPAQRPSFYTRHGADLDGIIYGLDYFYSAIIRAQYSGRSPDGIEEALLAFMTNVTLQLFKIREAEVRLAITLAVHELWMLLVDASVDDSSAGAEYDGEEGSDEED